MKVFDPIPFEGFQFVHPVPPDDWESITRRFDAHVAGKRWIARPLKLFREEGVKKLERGDWLYLDHHIPVVRATAARALEPVLDPGDLFLPMKCGRERLYIIRPKWTIDALDEVASTLWRFDDGRIMAIRKHIFKEEPIGNLAAFYITRIRSSTFYVTDPFVQAWQAAGLRGLRFKLLWESGTR